MNLQTSYLKDVYHFGGKKPNLLRVLTYHRIGSSKETPLLEPRQISASTDVFDKQMAILKQNWHVISINEVIDSIKTNSILPPKSVLITFDDASVDVKSEAYPILKKYNLPATVFVPTAYPNHPEKGFWWDRLFRAVVLTQENFLKESPIGQLSLNTLEARKMYLKQLQNHLKTLSNAELEHWVGKISADLNCVPVEIKTVLEWDELRELAKEKLLSFGAHTQSHPILTQVSDSEAYDEMIGSFEKLRSEIPEAVKAFAYPNGNSSPIHHEMLKEYGCEAAFTTTDGINNLHTANPFALRRINVTSRTSPAIFKMRIQRWGSYLDLVRH